MVEGPQSALAIVDRLIAGGELNRYHLVHAARADLLRRMGSLAEAAESYEHALALVQNDSERRFLERRLREMRSGSGALSAS
jgi:RNA polymerase sigma-70 factor (ECF subfamily)